MLEINRESSIHFNWLSHYLTHHRSANRLCLLLVYSWPNEELNITLNALECKLRKTLKHVSVCMFISLDKCTVEHTYCPCLQRIPQGFFHLWQRATEINRVFDHGNWRSTPWWIDMLHQSSESINHLSFGAVFNRNFPHLAALPAAPESYLWGWITRLLQISDYALPLSCHHCCLSSEIRLLRKQTSKLLSYNNRVKVWVTS